MYDKYKFISCHVDDVLPLIVGHRTIFLKDYDVKL